MLKKITSILLAVLMLMTSVSVLPAFVYAADTVVKTTNIKSEKDLFDQTEKGYTGAFFTSASNNESKTFTFTVNADCYAFINIYSYRDDLSNYVSQDITMVSTNPVEEIFSHYTFDKAASTINELKPLNAGTYRIQIQEKREAGTHTVINVGLLGKNTEFLTAAYVKTVKNSGNQSMVLKVTALDTIKELYADNSNYGYVSGVETVGKPYTLDANGYITVPVDTYNSQTYPYFTLRSKDNYGVAHEYWFGAITPETAIVEGIKDKAYTGKALTQNFTVRCFNDTPTYKVEYKNNTAVGTATVTIKGFGRWNGTATKTFKINPKGTAFSKVTPGAKKMTVTWKKQATQTTGYELQYSLKKNMKGAKTVTVKKNSTVKAVVKKLKSKKTYYVRIRTFKNVSGKKYYSAWSKKKSVKIK